MNEQSIVIMDAVNLNYHSRKVRPLRGYWLSVSKESLSGIVGPTDATKLPSCPHCRPNPARRTYSH